MFKRKEHMSKIVYYFILYTYFTFLIGLVLKIVLVVHLFDQSKDISNAKEKINQIYAIWSKTGHRPAELDHSIWSNIKTIDKLKEAIDHFRVQQQEQKIALILQFSILVLTLIIYSRSLWDMTKMNKAHYVYKKKNYRAFLIEYIVFLTLFVLIDSFALYLVFKEQPEMGGWLIYTLTSLFIPTTFAIISILFIVKTKKYIKVNV